MRVVSLLPSATDTVVALGIPNILVGRSHECDWPEVKALEVLTSSRVGNIPIEEIDAVHSASAAAVQELALLGPDLAIPLLEFGLTVYHLHVDKLRELRPDVILTCLQTAHGAVLQAELLHAALEAALGYVPKVVHCAAQTLAESWADMQAIAEALGHKEQGRALVAQLQQRMEAAATACRGRPQRRVAVLQWPQPMYAAGGWVPEMVMKAGSRDVCGRVEEAVCLNEEDLAAAQPEVIIFALCGVSLKQSLRSAAAVARRLGAGDGSPAGGGGAGSAVGAGASTGMGVWGRLPAAAHGRVAVVDGQRVFSRAGPLLVESMEVLVEVLHPEAQDYGHQGELWKQLELPGGKQGRSEGTRDSMGAREGTPAASTEGRALTAV